MVKLKFITLFFFFGFLCMCNSNHVLYDITEKLSQNDEPLSEPQPGEWLYEHHDKGQGLKQYQSANPVSPNRIQNKIYLKPIGTFNKEQEKIIKLTAEYLQIFYGLEVIISKTISDTIIPEFARRNTQDGSTQLFAPYILDSILKPKIPNDAIIEMAICEKDLYPDPNWNYVFGLARLKERIGVSSIYRYYQTAIDSSNYSVCLERLIKTSSHEIGHMFSICHCIHALCLMNGSNSLPESDSKPNRFCSECSGKLFWNLKVDPKKRFKQLSEYFLKHALIPDYKRTLADQNLIL